MTLNLTQEQIKSLMTVQILFEEELYCQDLDFRLKTPESKLEQQRNEKLLKLSK